MVCRTRLTSPNALLMMGLTARLALGQTTVTSRISASDATSSTSAAASYTDPLIQSLWAGAESLLSEYYPSSSLTNVASLTWPATVVLGSSTISLSSNPATLSTVSGTTADTTPTPTLAATNSTSESSSSQQASSNSNSHSDKRLGIGLGVGLGVVAVGLLVFLIWLLNRRKKRTGTFEKHRPATPSETEINSWRAPSHSSEFPEKYINMQAPHPPTPPTRAHPAYAHGWSDDEIRPTANSSGEISGASNPLYTPYETYAELTSGDSRRHSKASLHELHGESSMQMLNHHQPTTPIARSPNAAVGRPSTPYSPELMRGAMSPVSPISPVDDTHHGRFWRDLHDYTTPYQEDYSSRYGSRHASVHHNSESSNPFLSEEDEPLEAPPSIPMRSERRRSSPVIHFPTGDELSTFDFGIEGERRLLHDESYSHSRRKPIPRRESVIGRQEMA